MMLIFCAYLRNLRETLKLEINKLTAVEHAETDNKNQDRRDGRVANRSPAVIEQSDIWEILVHDFYHDEHQNAHD